jgi:hypothetical protein
LGTSTQHNLLKDLSDTFPGDVFYVAPRFHRYSDYDTKVMGKQVFKDSIIVDLRPMKLFTDSRRHCVAYNSTVFAEFSDGRKLGPPVSGEEFLAQIERVSANDVGEEPSPRSAERTIVHLKSVLAGMRSVLNRNELELAEIQGLDVDDDLGGRFQRGREDPVRNFIRIGRLIELIRWTAIRYFGASWFGVV